MSHNDLNAVSHICREAHYVRIQGHLWPKRNAQSHVHYRFGLCKQKSSADRRIADGHEKCTRRPCCVTWRRYGTSRTRPKTRCSDQEIDYFRIPYLPGRWAKTENAEAIFARPLQNDSR